ncbi:MAG: hypothetical protein Q4F43_00825 [Eubacteriales bacterium]|nr:hypothetical protein [Eubacteriales bacterium]
MPEAGSAKHFFADDDTMDRSGKQVSLMDKRKPRIRKRAAACMILCMVCCSVFFHASVHAQNPVADRRGGQIQTSGDYPQTTDAQTQTQTPDSRTQPGDSQIPEIPPSDLPSSAGEVQELKKKEPLPPLTDKQRSSIAILNHMTVLSQEINSSSNSRLYLDNAYSDIVNNINPNAIDEDSMAQIKMLLDTIYEYQTMESKRERLRYIYEQNRADAVKVAMQAAGKNNELSLGINPAAMLVPIVHMAVDASSSYRTYINELDEQYLEEGWILDDNAADTLHESRRAAFSYMVEMCQKQSLDGRYALNEKSVENFVSWENNPNPTRRIDYLEKNQETYQMYGKYWLVLAQSYYEKSDYADCLNAIDTYEDMEIDTFRKDHDFAKACTMAVSAASELYSSARYVSVADHYLELLLENIEPEDWMLRYFAAQVYTDLYERTENRDYLQEAYDLAETNVNSLIDVQHQKNEEYLADVEKEEVPKDATNEEKKEIKNYNKWLKEERKTALPPAYQPLVVNCDLLFKLARELNISDTEKMKIEEILYAGDQPLFLIEPLDALYHFEERSGEQADSLKQKIVFDGKRFEIPVSVLEQGSTLRMTLTKNGKEQTFADWTIDKVTRGTRGEIDSFTAVFSSASLGKQKYTEDTKVRLEILPPQEYSYDPLQYTFRTTVGRKWLVRKDMKFELEE